LESEYLVPILKGPKEFTINGKLNFDKPTKKHVVLIQESDRSKIKPHALNYLKYGEKNPHGAPYSNTETCKNRSPWWKLSPVIYPDVVFTMDFSSKYMFPKTNRLLDNRLYFGKGKKKGAAVAVYAFVNSSLFFLYPDLYGRNYGGGGAPVEFKIYELEKVPVPKLELLEPYSDDLKKNMDKMEKRIIGTVFDEIWDMKGVFSLDCVKPDRLELDKIVLKSIGFKKPEEFLIEWYPSVVKTIKERLDKATSVKTTKTTSQSINLSRVADDIIKQLKFKNFPTDYLSTTYKSKSLKIKSGNKIDMGRDLKGNYVSIDKEKLYFEDKYVTKFVYYCAKRHIEDILLLKNASDIKEILEEFEKDLKEWKKLLNTSIEDITDDQKYRKKLLEICTNKMNYSGLL